LFIIKGNRAKYPLQDRGNQIRKGDMAVMKKTYGLMMLLLFMIFTLSSCSSGGDAVFLTPAAQPLTVFVTHATGDGKLDGWADAGGNTGVAAGDAVCQAAATAAGLSGTYKAWLSDGTTDAYCHIQGYTGTVTLKCGQATLPVAAGPWIRTDGFPFAGTIDELISNGQVFAPVRYDEYGAVVATADADWYFTDTLADGTRNGSQHCAGWTSNSGSAALGRTAGATNWWTQVTGASCSNIARLLCFQTGTGGPLPSITAPASSKKVFVTSVRGKGDLTDATSWPAYSGSATGVAAGDTICRTLAAARSIPNAANFKAWLTDTTHIDAIARFNSAGPWYRLDGVKVADNKAALAASGTTPLFTAITYTETGVYVQDEVYRVWSGTNNDGGGLTLNCNDWGSSLVADTGVLGDTHTSDGWWTNFTSQTCDQQAALYCFEDE
jgi:hypothetical protein